MLFVLIIITFVFIFFIAFFGDYKSRELEKQKKDWERVIGRKYE